MSHWLWFLHRGAWEREIFAAESLICPEGVETEGCLMTALPAHSAISSFIEGESSRCLTVITTPKVMKVALNSTLLRSGVVGHMP